MFSKVNLKDELKKFQSKENSDILDLVNNQLLNDELMENNIKKNLNSCATSNENIDLTTYNENDVYDLKSIKSIAVKYRLRFLPTKYFKNEIPQEAIFKTKSLEKKNNTSIKNFHILAPATSFDLRRCQQRSSTFCSSKKWQVFTNSPMGNRPSMVQKTICTSFRSLESILISIGFVALFLSLITPTWLILNSAEIDMGYFGYHRIAWFLYAYILISSITTFICFSQNIYPSEYQWNKKTYN